MDLQSAVIVSEIIAFILGVVYYKKYFNTNLKYFLFLLGIMLSIELFYTFITDVLDKRIENNTAVYNLLSVLEFCTYFFIYYSFSKKIRHRKIIFFIGVFYLLSVIINFSFFQKLSSTGSFHLYTYAIGALLLVVVIGLYIIEILKSDEVLHIKKSLLFWISSGLLIYYVGVLPFWIGLPFIPESELKNASYILFSLSIIMYSCFIFGFIWSKRLST